METASLLHSKSECDECRSSAIFRCRRPGSYGSPGFVGTPSLLAVIVPASSFAAILPKRRWSESSPMGSRKTLRDVDARDPRVHCPIPGTGPCGGVPTKLDVDCIVADAAIGR